MTGNAVKSMTIPETLGAGLIGGIADSALLMTVGNKIPLLANAGIEIAAGLISGAAIGGGFGQMMQNGLVITGCNKIVNLGTAAIMGMMSGKNTAAPAAANSGNTDGTLY